MVSCLSVIEGSGVIPWFNVYNVQLQNSPMKKPWREKVLHVEMDTICMMQKNKMQENPYFCFATLLVHTTTKDAQISPKLYEGQK
jgi:hypothetical protein